MKNNSIEFSESSKIHRDRITNLLNLRKNAQNVRPAFKNVPQYAEKPIDSIVDRTAVYDIKRNVIEIRPVSAVSNQTNNEIEKEETIEAPIDNDKGPDLMDICAKAPSSASSNTTISSSSVSVTGFASPKNSSSSSTKDMVALEAGKLF